jgi:hypothetical protein
MAETFMSYNEYMRKQEELADRIQKLKQRYDFSYEGMGRIDDASEREGKRLSEESMKLEEQARQWAKRYPNWEKLRSVV